MKKKVTIFIFMFFYNALSAGQLIKNNEASKKVAKEALYYKKVKNTMFEQLRDYKHANDLKKDGKSLLLKHKKILANLEKLKDNIFALSLIKILKNVVIPKRVKNAAKIRIKNLCEAYIKVLSEFKYEAYEINEKRIILDELNGAIKNLTMDKS